MFIEAKKAETEVSLRVLIHGGKGFTSKKLDKNVNKR